MAWRGGRIAHMVTYVNENGQRLSIPKGPCQIQEHEVPGRGELATISSSMNLQKWSGPSIGACAQ
jgi:hypothetical protein